MPSQYADSVTSSRTVTRVFCPEGHNLLDICYSINGLAGIKLKFRCRDGAEGLVVLSPSLGCFDRLVLAGELVDGEKVDLICPHCDIPLPKKGLCGCRDSTGIESGDLCLLYLSRDMSVDEAIAICNVVGCHNSSLRHAGEYLHA